MTFSTGKPPHTTKPSENRSPKFRPRAGCESQLILCYLGCTDVPTHLPSNRTVVPRLRSRTAAVCQPFAPIRASHDSHPRPKTSTRGLPAHNGLTNQTSTNCFDNSEPYRVHTCMGLGVASAAQESPRPGMASGGVAPESCGDRLITDIPRRGLVPHHHGASARCSNHLGRDPKSAFLHSLPMARGVQILIWLPPAETRPQPLQQDQKRDGTRANS